MPRPSKDKCEEAIGKWKKELFAYPVRVSKLVVDVRQNGELSDWPIGGRVRTPDLVHEPSRWPDPLARLPTSYEEGRWGAIDTIAIQDEIHRTVREVFGGKEMSMDDFYRPTFPSTSANYINTRDMFGSVGTILKDDKFKELSGRLSFNDLCEFDVAQDRVWNETTETFEDVQFSRFDFEGLRQRNEILVNHCLNESMIEQPYVEPVALSEALKVRMITKCPPFLMYSLSTTASWLRRVMRKHPTFVLTGKEVDEEIVSSVMGRCCRGQKYLSGDYKAATDRLKSFVSNAVADALCNGPLLKICLDFPQLRVNIKRGLTGFKLADGSCQIDGQLMGSIISFPVLCLVNATMCRMALEVGQRKTLLLKECPLLINGDDCLLRTNEAGREFWLRTTSKAGLTPSLGKVLWHKTIAQINSRNFKFSRDGFLNHRFERVYCKQIPVLMMGLFNCLSRSSSEVGNGQGRVGGTYGSLSSRVKTLLKLCPVEIRDQVRHRFMGAKVLPKLKKVEGIRDVPWYVPSSYGGLGLPLPEGRDLSQKDINFCWEIRKKGYLILTEKNEQQWKVYQNVISRLRRYNVGLSYNLAEDCKVPLGNFYMSELFLSKWKNINLSFGNPTLLRDPSKYLRVNGSLWQRSKTKSFKRAPSWFDPFESELGELCINGSIKWFKSCERERRDFLSGWSNGTDPTSDWVQNYFADLKATLWT
jgi:hypothetical protein